MTTTQTQTATKTEIKGVVKCPHCGRVQESFWHSGGRLWCQRIRGWAEVTGFVCEGCGKVKNWGRTRP
jgi:predicted RNA-binding Zn-ribbon protein involved in translation (DUF1610 family)